MMLLATPIDIKRSRRSDFGRSRRSVINSASISRTLPFDNVYILAAERQLRNIAEILFADIYSIFNELSIDDTISFLTNLNSVI